MKQSFGDDGDEGDEDDEEKKKERLAWLYLSPSLCLSFPPPPPGAGVRVEEKFLGPGLSPDADQYCRGGCLQAT